MNFKYLKIKSSRAPFVPLSEFFVIVKAKFTVHGCPLLSSIVPKLLG
jgi:hypothetical protein